MRNNYVTMNAYSHDQQKKANQQAPVMFEILEDYL